MTKYIKILGLMSLFVFLLLAGMKIYKINQSFPQVEQALIPLGESCIILGSEITVDSCKIGTPESFGIEATYADERLIVVEVRIYNPSNLDVTLPLYRLTAESGAWANGLTPLYFSKMNPNFDSYIITVNAKETVEVKLTYTMTSNQFSDVIWENIDNQEFFVTFLEYPSKISFVTTQ